MAPAFNAAFETNMHDVNCARHILDNARNAPKTEKVFHENMFWAVQGAKSEAEYWDSLSKFKRNYPNVYEYLKNIPIKTWVRFKQLELGATTCSWRTSNLAEIGQSQAVKLRAFHPLDFFSEFVSSSLAAVAEEASEQEEFSKHPAGIA